MFLGGGCSLATEPLANISGRHNISMVINHLVHNNIYVDLTLVGLNVLLTLPHIISIAMYTIASQVHWW